MHPSQHPPPAPQNRCFFVRGRTCTVVPVRVFFRRMSSVLCNLRREFATGLSTAVVEPPSPATKVLAYFHCSFRSGGWRLYGAPEGGGGTHPKRPRNKHILIIYVFPTFRYPED